MRDLAFSRHFMIERHLRARGVRDPLVLDAMERVPREAFVTAELEEFAYEDSALPISEDQTISQPYIVGLMIEKAGIEPGDAVLEIGTGSGYAAAVMSQIAGHVYTMERFSSLAEEAGLRFKRLGYHNVIVRKGDGSRGWPEAAPFDAIVVAAAAPGIPQALKEQLEIGGHLVIPVGSEDDQRLLRLTRRDAAVFEEEDLGGVRFVPLIGIEGWHADPEETQAYPGLPSLIGNAAEWLPDFDDPSFGPMFDRLGSKRVVMLGEATHGTSEFYRARAAVTRRLVEEHGFNIVAVEADWPDAADINRYVRHLGGRILQAPFQRFPTWVWRNAEVLQFVAWLRTYNGRGEPADSKVGFYGLDLYNMSGSITSVLRYLDDTDPEAAQIARERYGCLAPWQDDPAAYGRSALSDGYARCEEKVVAQCRDLLRRQLEGLLDVDDELLDAAQNARLIAAAEHYYRVMYHGGAESWNLRDTHMFETLDRLLAARGDSGKAVVWAHNSHVGDARHTDMGSIRTHLNIGQLCREAYGSDVALIGFGTHSGTVAAASDWGGPMEVKTLRPALGDSYEDAFHDAGCARCLVDFEKHPVLRERLLEPRLERMVGVIYRPESERLSHYMYASLGRQYDAFVWFDQTQTITPIKTFAKTLGAPGTFPFGL
jgi:protein-L-isoaspartate(D-aspartate) O-methyltransferase